MYCRSTSAHKFGTSLRFKQYDVILIKDKSVLTKIMSSFEEENMLKKCNLLGLKIDLYFHDCKLPKEIDGNWHSARIIGYEIIKQKALEQELGCKFIRIGLNREDFSVLRTINEIFRHIKHSTKKALNKILTRLLGLEFRPDNIIKEKAMELIVKKYCPIISNNVNA